jgi:adenosylcobinamide-GDP ribazoletransferase
MRPLLIALQFLTRVPVRLDPAPSPAETGRSLLWYPVVGLLMGALLVAAARLMSGVMPSLQAALLLGLWVAASGALHLDGLADTADAWIGGGGDRERTLAIMKDPHVGPVAVAALAVVLLLKFSAIEACLHQPATLMLAPLLGRAAMPALFASTIYVRANGIGSTLAAQFPRRGAVLVVAAVIAGTAAIYRLQGVIAAAVATSALLIARQAYIRRLGGFTGDCAGATLELVEAAVIATLGILA